MKENNMKKKKKRGPRLASSKNGFQTMSEIYGSQYGDHNRFKTYEEVTVLYEAEVGKSISINTACNYFHRGMYKIASEILEHKFPGKFDEKEKKRISRSPQFQVYLREVLEDLYAENDLIAYAREEDIKKDT